MRASIGVVSSAKAGAWTPASLPSLAGWWDADDASTFTYSSGVLVSQWNDKSGMGYHFTQATAAKQPSRDGTINGKPSVVLNGTSHSMFATAPTQNRPYSLLAVARNTSASGQRDLITCGSAVGQGRIFRPTTGEVAIFQGATLSAGVAWGTTAAHSVAVAFVGAANAKIAADSAAWVTGSAGSTAPGSDFRLGAYHDETEFWQGDICEIVHVNAGISDADRVQWMSYAKTKWGTP